MKANKLVQRWETGEGKTLRMKIINFLKNNTFEKDETTFKQFEKTKDDLLDFRGINLRENTVEKYDFSNVYFENMDFSFANLDNIKLYQCKFKNVRFAGALAWSILDDGCTFENVNFDKADLRGSLLGLDGSKYFNCSFKKNKWGNKETSFIRAELKNCTFEDIKSVDFNASSFKNCKFIGKIKNVWFSNGFLLTDYERRYGKPQPNTMENVDFSEACLFGIRFVQNCPLDKVILPKDGNHFYFRNWKSLMLKVDERVKKEWVGKDKEDAQTLITWLVAGNQDEWILNKNDLVEFGGKKFADDFIKLLKESEKEVKS